MKISKWLLWSVMALLTACKGERETESFLDISGHWLVNHGFYDDCQVGATFTDQQLVLTFYSLQPGACTPEKYGIENNALTIEIYSKEDYFDESGALAIRLQVAVPARKATGTFVLTETVSGLDAVLASANDPNGLLQPLLEPTYHLTRVSEEWVPLALGTWGADCADLEPPGQTGAACEVLEFTGAATGRINVRGGGGTSGPDGILEPVGEPATFWEDAIYALRHLTKEREGPYELDMAIITAGGDASISIPMTVTLSAGSMVLTASQAGEEPRRLELYPIAEQE